MKPRLLIMFALVGFVSLISTTQIVQAVPELTFDDAYDFSELVIVGQIESVEILSEPVIGENTSRSGIALYDVTILFSLKNPDNITEITVHGKFLREPHGMSYDAYPYEVGQTVVLFIQPDDYVSGYDLVIRSGNSEVIYPASEQDGQCKNHRYSYYGGYCMRTEIQNQDLPTCNPNSEHDFGKCKKSEPESIIDERCGVNTVSIDGVCQVVKVKTVGDDAPFFGIFVYLDDLISWIFGK